MCEERHAISFISEQTNDSEASQTNENNTSITENTNRMNCALYQAGIIASNKPTENQSALKFKRRSRTTFTKMQVSQFLIAYTFSIEYIYIVKTKHRKSKS
jgi:hypothetical protein